MRVLSYLAIVLFAEVVRLANHVHARRMLPHIHHLIHLQALGHLVRDKDHRHLAFGPVDRLRKMLGGVLIQVRNRLVEDQHLGPLEQRAGDGDALALWTTH